jgi:quercetin dioxygenase-like cupin family protein
MQVYNWNKDSDRTETDGYSRGVAAGRDIMMAHVVMDAGAVTSAHSHAYEEIIYVVKGKWTIKLGEESITLEANQSLVVPSGIEHSSVAVEDTVAVVSTNYRPEWQENTDYWLHYNTENHLWAV